MNKDQKKTPKTSAAQTSGKEPQNKEKEAPAPQKTEKQDSQEKPAAAKEASKDAPAKPDPKNQVQLKKQSSSQDALKKDAGKEDKEKEEKEASSAAEKDLSAQDKTIKKTHSPKDQPVSLNALFAYKLGMTNVYDEKNQYTPVTALQYKPCRVTQIKTKEKDGYFAVQVALESQKNNNKPLKNHLKKAGLEKKAHFIREVRQGLPDNIKLGQAVSIESLKKGDIVRLSGISKGHGFSGVVKRWGFGGGPASHGAEKHRTTGSVANTATQGRVFPGKKMPGQFGCRRTAVSNVKVVDVEPASGLILVKGSVPGSIQSLVELKKQRSL